MIENATKNDKLTVDILESIIRKNSTLANILLQGNRINSPFIKQGFHNEQEFEGKNFPTYFDLDKKAQKYTKNNPKKSSRNRQFQIQYITDAENAYFNRDKDKGEFNCVYMHKNDNEISLSKYSINLWNGSATLTISLSDPNVSVGDMLFFRTQVFDISTAEILIQVNFIFWLKTKKRSKIVKRDRTGIQVLMVVAI